MQLLILISHPTAQYTVMVHLKNTYFSFMVNKYPTKMAVIPTKLHLMISLLESADLVRMEEKTITA